MLRPLFAVLLSWGGSLAAVAAPSPDFAREERIRAEISDVILDGEVIDLAADNGRSFLSLYTEQTTANQAKGTVVILHSRGLHPDWATVIHPLRVGLPDAGWHSLSIQLPVLDKTATYYDYVPVFPAAVPRIEAAIAEARVREPGAPVVLLAHSCGYHMAQHWISARGPDAVASIDAFIRYRHGGDRLRATHGRALRFGPGDRSNARSLGESRLPGGPAPGPGATKQDAHRWASPQHPVGGTGGGSLFHRAQRSLGACGR
jgi:hypothetical protein